MTPDDTDAWRALFGMVVVTCSQTFDSHQSRFYFELLKDLPFPEVDAGVKSVMRTWQWPSLPKPGDIRDAVHKLRVAAKREQLMAVAGSRLTPAVICQDCRDTGMRETSDNRYGPCPCRPTNQNYQVNHARQRMADETEQPLTIGPQEAQQFIALAAAPGRLPDIRQQIARRSLDPERAGR